VYSIGQTGDGYLWFGTQSGLVRFDGVTFQQVHSASLEPLLSLVKGLATDAQGVMWLRLGPVVSTLLRYDRGTFHSVILTPPVFVSAVAPGRNGAAICLLSRGGTGTAIVPCGKADEVATPFSVFQRSAVLAIAQTSIGDFWLGTSGDGLFRVRNGQVEAVREGLPDLKVNALAPGTNGELWAGTDGGLVRWDGAKLTTTGIPDSLRGVQMLAVSTDRDSNVWLGTNSRGLLRLNARGVASLAWPEGGTPML
jgi:ligand-binding sensor domain-containing protein